MYIYLFYVTFFNMDCHCSQPPIHFILFNDIPVFFCFLRQGQQKQSKYLSLKKNCHAPHLTTSDGFIPRFCL